MNDALNATASLAAARGLYYAAAMLLFGDLAFSLLIHAKLPIIVPPRDMRLRWSALAVAAAAGLTWFLMAVAGMAGTLDRQAVIQAITATLFGQLFLVRIVALAALALVFKRGARLAVLLALAALILPAATSHAAAASPAGFTALGTSLDGLHLLTAGFWVGGLAVLLQLHRRGEPNILLALSLFSDWAMIAVLLLVMTGLINATSILLGGKGTPSQLYLTVLGAKLVLVAGMLGLAAMNRFRLMPRGNDQAIARNVALELGAGVTAVLLAGVLSQLQPTL
ncbi:MAG TPA: CopD family protein [Rhizomicrobium sp.]|nr:CopD family protein [Rhizomicrobium sp.]